MIQTLQLGGLEGGAVSSLHFAIYITSRFTFMKQLFLLTTHSNFSVLNFKLGLQINYPLAWMFFFRTLAIAFPTYYHMKTVCCC